MIDLYLTQTQNFEQTNRGRLRRYWLQLRNHGKPVDAVAVNTGAPGHEPVLPANDWAGSLRPIPEGVYRIGPIERAKYGSWGPGLGQYWVDLIGLPAYRVNNRGAFGIHLDASRANSPGSAGCVVTETDAQLERILGWLRQNARPEVLVVDYGFGFLKERGYSDPGLVTPAESAAREMTVAGLTLVKHFEGLRLAAYQCPAGVWTIGYGHTNGVFPGQTITEAEAERRLRQDLNYFGEQIQRLTKTPLSDHQYSALTSFAFNVGTGSYERSTLLRELNQGRYAAAAEELLRWDKAMVRGLLQPLAGLTRRRRAEKLLFEMGVFRAA